jgi:hypothetical protein
LIIIAAIETTPYSSVENILVKIGINKNGIAAFIKDEIVYIPEDLNNEELIILLANI